MKVTFINNELIDIFMKSKGEYISYKDQWGGEVWGEYKPHNYHSDWNELMRVVQKIESLKYSKELFKEQSEVIALPISTEKEIVYNSCIKFIKWYNKQNK